MAKSFSTLKDPKLGLLDKITFGKLKDCRVCDVVEDHYEYLIWAEKQGYVKFQQEVTDLILEQAHFEKWEAPVEDNKHQDLFELVTRQDYYSTFEDDVPF